MNKYALILCVATTLAAPAAMGAAVVTEPMSDRVDRLEKLLDGQTSYEVHEQMQRLQEELQTLRGVIEVNEHEIAQLKQRQRELYADLDSRIVELNQGVASADTKPTLTKGTAKPAKADKADTDLDSYQSAYDLLKNQHYADAIKAFDKHVKRYPEGEYTPNAYYWLGETHIIHDDLEAAKKAFESVLAQYPDHQKAGDAMLKLGFVYDAAGQTDKAVKTLNQVKDKYPNSSVARLADQRLVQIKQRS